MKARTYKKVVNRESKLNDKLWDLEVKGCSSNTYAKYWMKWFKVYSQVWSVNNNLYV